MSETPASLGADSEREAMENWFLRRGLPQFIVDYEGTRGFLTRALPLLVAIFLFQVFLAVNIRWGLIANTLAVLGGLGVLGAVWGASNLLRRRHVFSRPERLGIGELAVFVVGPAILPLIFGLQVFQAVTVAIINLALVALVYSAASFALIPMFRWALRSIGKQVGATIQMAARALPLLLIVVIFSFFTQEMWQLAGNFDTARLMLVSCFFFAVGCVFLVSRLPGQASEDSVFVNADLVHEALEATPFAGAGERHRGLIRAEVETGQKHFAPEDLGPDSIPVSDRRDFEGVVRALTDRPHGFSQREWANVLLVLLFRQGMQILAVTLTLGLFYLAMGTFVVDIPLQADWVRGPVTKLVDLTLWGRELALTEQVLKVSIFLTAFSGLFLTVQVFTDKTYRMEFTEELTKEIRDAFAVRLVYRVLFVSGEKSVEDARQSDLKQ